MNDLDELLTFWQKDGFWEELAETLDEESLRRISDKASQDPQGFLDELKALSENCEKPAVLSELRGMIEAELASKALDSPEYWGRVARLPNDSLQQLVAQAKSAPVGAVLGLQKLVEALPLAQSEMPVVGSMRENVSNIVANARPESRSTSTAVSKSEAEISKKLVYPDHSPRVKPVDKKPAVHKEEDENRLKVELDVNDLKARTMYDMVKVVDTDAGAKRVMFITNDQCKVLSSLSNVVQKIIKAFEIPKPNLVIQLLLSHGDTAWVDQSKKVWPEKPHTLDVIGHPPLNVEPGMYFSFEAENMQNYFGTTNWSHGVYSVEVNGSVFGKVKVFDDREQKRGCYGRWEPKTKAKAGDWKEGDKMIIVKNTGMNPYAYYPWETKRHSLDADERLINFMQNVVIPLAAETKAVILCQGHEPDCMLSMAFAKAFELRKHEWKGKPPFTVIGMSCMMKFLYKGNPKKQFWRRLQDGVTNWKAQEPRYKEKWGEKLDTDRICDLNQSLDYFIINDTLEISHLGASGETNAPYFAFTNSLIHAWTNVVPALSMVSGFQFADRILLPLQGGSQVVFLDSRVRNGAELTGIKDIKDAKKCDTEFREQLLKAGTSDFLWVETLSFFHTALKKEEQKNASEQGGVKRPIHRQIEDLKNRLAASAEGTDAADTEPAAQRESKIDDLARYVAENWNTDMFRVLPDVERRKGKGEREEEFNLNLRLEKIRHFRLMLGHRNMHSLNTSDIREAKRLIDSLVKLDRVPPEEPLDGLVLLKEAWEHYDLKMYLANWYKKLAKVIYVFTLFLGLASVTVTVLEGRASEDRDRQQLCTELMSVSPNDLPADCADSQEDPLSVGLSGGLSSYLLFFLSVATSVLISLEGYFNSGTRWRQLRTAAQSLESTIWKYRTRTGEFAETKGFHQPQIAFSEAIKSWTADLMSGSDLSGTSMEKQYSRKVFKHYQHDGGMKLSEDEDDYHSPVPPNVYISLRLKPRQKFYEKRIPIYVTLRFLLQVMVFICSATSAVLAFMKQTPWVAVVTSVAAALTSWAGFASLGPKVERYSNTIRGIKDLDRWWTTLTPVQQSSALNIHDLVNQGEMLVNSEFRTWSSYLAESKLDNGLATEEEGQEGNVKMQVAERADGVKS